jgi:hypothetical protein
MAIRFSNKTSYGIVMPTQAHVIYLDEPNKTQSTKENKGRRLVGHHRIPSSTGNKTET